MDDKYLNRKTRLTYFSCRFCGMLRFHKKIKAYKTKIPHGFHHVNYCIDKDECLAGAVKMSEDLLAANKILATAVEHK